MIMVNDDDGNDDHGYDGHEVLRVYLVVGEHDDDSDYSDDGYLDDDQNRWLVKMVKMVEIMMMIMMTNTTWWLVKAVLDFLFFFGGCLFAKFNWARSRSESTFVIFIFFLCIDICDHTRTTVW